MILLGMNPSTRLLIVSIESSGAHMVDPYAIRRVVGGRSGSVEHFLGVIEDEASN